ncbi:cell wall-binding repeat-containing protein [Georgenia sp. SYP-B2076]|uniref:cell wall-binding repeat-containing protein n=1 Tax=Georgenia sp. SYP-B2076 TaxID=2495881 RepID=UPI0013DFC916|nr:cell wall-binding repeat-containing protein [Georgenia sp. SYP-B2076]
MRARPVIAALAAVVVAVTAMAVPAVGAGATAAGTAEISRLEGTDRYVTAATISEATFAPGVKVAYVASGTDFPDALAGAPVAGMGGAPVLLVPPSGIPASVRTELVRLKPGRVVVLGGTGAVSAAIETQLGTYTRGGVTRLDGADRYATAATISEASFAPGVKVAYVASGTDFPDALAGAPVAGMGGAPVLLVPPSGIPAAVRTELVRLKPGRVVVLGGTGAVSAAVKTQLGTYTRGGVTRLDGADRYATSATISKASFTTGADVVYLASGTGFPDALAGAPAAATAGAPVLLVAPTGLPAAVRTELVRLRPASIVVVGGPGAVSGAVAAQAATAVAGSEIARIAAAYSAPPAGRGAGVRALAWAQTQLGVPYRYGGADPTGYDCSGLVMRAYENAGVQLTRTTRQQWASTTRVALADLQPGDIVFWSSDGEPSGIYHNALYAGVDPVTGKHMRLQSPSPGKVVELVPMYETNLLPFGGRIG